jgi:predicted metal-dependent hydrolase
MEREPLSYLGGYSEAVLERVRGWIARDELGAYLAERYTVPDRVLSNRELYDAAQELKRRHLRSSPPLSKVVFDPKLQVIENALGLHSSVSRVHGGRLVAKREIRIARLFERVPEEFLRMILVHELAHLREPDHDRAFYALCRHMEPDYEQYEFDLRLSLIQRDLERRRAGGPAPD